MNIAIKNYKQETDIITIEYLVEREKQTYNNIIETVTLNKSETMGLTDNEIKTLGFKKIKPVAIRVFEQIEPLNEDDHSIDFELIPAIPKSIIIQGPNSLTIGQVCEYYATVYDQYNMPLDVELTWINKIINANKIGVLKVTASVGDIINSRDISIIERVKTNEEKSQEELLSLKLALVEQSEKAIQDKADLQLALAEIAENMGGI